jgi:hypothetical protein
MADTDTLRVGDKVYIPLELRKSWSCEDKMSIHSSSYPSRRAHRATLWFRLKLYVTEALWWIGRKLHLARLIITKVDVEAGTITIKRVCFSRKG